MAAIYKVGVVTIIPKMDIGQPNPMANVINYQTAAVGLTVAQLTAIQTAFDTAWAAWWRPLSPNTNRYMGCWVIDMGSASGNQVTNSAYTPLLGTGAGASWGDQQCALISLKTQNRYRGGHGRVYIGGLNVAQMSSDGHQLATAAQTAITTGWNNTNAAMIGVSGAAGGPLNLIVWHKHWAAAPNTTEIVVTSTVQNVLATQRRRQRKVTRRRRS